MNEDINMFLDIKRFLFCFLICFSAVHFWA